MERLTFKQFLEQSRQQLVEAAKAAPCVERSFTVKRYCKFPVDINGEQTSIALKPKCRLLVTMLYEDMENPSIVSVKFENVDELDGTTSYKATWKDSKVNTWLSQNTKLNE